MGLDNFFPHFLRESRTPPQPRQRSRGVMRLVQEDHRGGTGATLQTGEMTTLNQRGNSSRQVDTPRRNTVQGLARPPSPRTRESSCTPLGSWSRRGKNPAPVTRSFSVPAVVRFRWSASCRFFTSLSEQGAKDSPSCRRPWRNSWRLLQMSATRSLNRTCGAKLVVETPP